MQYKAQILSTIGMISLLFSTTIHGHGFSGDTLVQLSNGSWQTIQTICLRALSNKISVASYETNTSYSTNQLIKSGRRSKSNCYIKIGFDSMCSDSNNGITCTPMQQFYVPKTCKWMHAYKLKVGDALLTKDNSAKPITHIKFIQKPLNIYTLEIKKSHTFFVSSHSILTHNMILPTALSIGLSLPFGSAAGGAAGGFFGPIGIIGGVVLGGIIGLTVKAMYEDRIPTYNIPEYDIAFIKKRCHNASLYTEEYNHMHGYEIASSADAALEPSLNITTEVGHVGNNTQIQPPKKPKNDDEDKNSQRTHPNGIYKGAKYHHKNSNGPKSPAPKDGQKALDNSVLYKPKSPHRVGTSEGQIVILSQTLPGEFHGHVRTWSELLAEAQASQPLRNALIQNGFVNSKGKILK